MGTNDFYYQFEDTFRGSSTLITQRLRAYDPILNKMKEIFASSNCTDLGCGRGEWLKLLEEHGFSAEGVDTDTKMVEKCEESHLRVTQGDALQFLTNLKPNSQAIISGFHIAEHLDFESLTQLFSEAHRALKPGGLLILETPNPENLIVSSRNFYLDPTHKHPLPPPLLSFLANYYKYARSVIWGLNQQPEIFSQQSFSLMRVLDGASPDYALIAQKPGDKVAFKTLNQIFLHKRGVFLNDAIQNYEEALTSRFTALSNLIAEIEEKASAAEAKANAAYKRAGVTDLREEAGERSFARRVTAPLRKLISLFSTRCGRRNKTVATHPTTPTRDKVPEDGTNTSA